MNRALLIVGALPAAATTFCAAALWDHTVAAMELVPSMLPGPVTLVDRRRREVRRVSTAGRG